MGRWSATGCNGICAGEGHIHHDPIWHTVASITRLEDALLRKKSGLLGIRDQCYNGAFRETAMVVLWESHFSGSAAEALTVVFDQSSVGEADHLRFHYARFVAGNASHAESKAKSGQTNSHWMLFTLNYRWLSIGVNTDYSTNNPLTPAQNDSSKKLIGPTFCALSAAECRARER